MQNRLCVPVLTGILWFSILAHAGDTPKSLAASPPISLVSRSLPVGLGTLDQIRILEHLELAAPELNGLRFVELSDLAWDDDDQVLYAVSNKGALFWLRPVFRADRLVDLLLLKAVPLREPRTQRILSGWRVDAEGMDVLRGRNGRKGDAELLISFERFPRIVRYRPDGYALQEYTLPRPLQDPKAYRDRNKALEAVAVSDAHGILTASEFSLRSAPADENRLYSLSGRSWRYPVAVNNGIVSMKAWGKTGLLILERDYKSWLGRALITLRKIDALPASPDALPKIDTLGVIGDQAGINIDNFEGVSAHRDKRFFLISDNNDIFFQRTHLIYFELR